MATHAGFLFPQVQNDKWPGTPAWLDTPVANNHDSVGVLVSSLLIGVTSDTQPIAENPVGHNGVRLPGFADDFYNRILIEPGKIDTGNLVSKQFYLIHVFNGYFEPKTLDNLILGNPDGVTLTGPAIGTSWGPLETKEYQLTVSTDGPPLIQSSMSFDWVGIADDVVVGVVGVRIVMLPFQAEAPFKESFEWKTNVLETNSGLEQRIRLRKAPRQFVQAFYPVDYAHSPLAFNMVSGWIGKRWAVGMWSETQYVGQVLNGVNVILCDTTNADFRPDSMLLLWESTDNNEALEIDTITPTQITLKRVVAGAYTHARMMPVRMGMPQGGVATRLSNGYNSGLSISYAITDNLKLESDVPAQYLGNDIYWDGTLIGDGEGALSEQFKTRQNEVDYDIGLVEYSAPWTHFKRARNVSFLNDGPEECWTFKKWLNRRAGRLRPYWLPTFEDNLRIKQVGIINSSLLCHDDSYKNLGLVNNHIAIQLDDGSWHPRYVSGISDDAPGLIRVSLDSPMFYDASRVRMICFLGLHRLNTDKVDIEWIGNYINQCAIQILEIKP